MTPCRVRRIISRNPLTGAWVMPHAPAETKAAKRQADGVAGPDTAVDIQTGSTPEHAR